MQASIEASLRKALHATDNAETPSQFEKGKAAGFVIGADDNAEAALLALDGLGVSPLFLLNKDSRDMYLLINKLKHIDIQGVRSVGMLKRELEDLDAKGNTVCLGIAAIPAPPPEFPSEDMVYAIADELLRSEYTRGADHVREKIGLPEKRIFLDMIDNSKAGIISDYARKAGWEVISLSDT